MKNIYSLIACFIIGVVLFGYRTSYSGLVEDKPLKVTTWDALGYYMYLPSVFIYDDITKLDWIEEVDSTYSVTGGELYQTRIHENGNHVFKYLSGVAVLESPFFFIGHLIALNTAYNADGFSPPYQYSIAFGAILYCFLALLLLRHILLKFFDDITVSLTLLLLVLASNLIQYVSIDSAQSHSFIFPLYVCVIYASIRWHEKPSLKWSAIIGLIIGIATISRPTELIMLFIPLFWGTQDKESRKAKWNLVKSYKVHVVAALIFGFVGILPQLIYWKIATGSLLYDVGSKWFFLNPFFRVLFGFENGWFIYTPVAILFVVGFFFIRKFPFRKSVIVFCLLNIWIVIAWSDWKYGATYSTRALVHSYPVFALPLAALISKGVSSKWRWPLLIASAYLIFVNLFQIDQYNSGVLHYRDMNRKYYSKIYLNNNPTPLDMSFLDTDELLKDPSAYSKRNLVSIDTSVIIEYEYGYGMLTEESLDVLDEKDNWLYIEAKILSSTGFSNSYLNCKIESENGNLEKRIRLFSPISKVNEINPYAFYVHLPEMKGKTKVKFFISTEGPFKGEIKSFSTDLFQK